MSDTTTVELSEAERNDRLAQLEAENAALKAKERQSAVEARVKELGDLGLSDHPGLLKEIRQIMLSDDGQPALMLSEEGSSTKKELSATEIVERIVGALPTKDGKITLSEQAFEPVPGSSKEDRPAADASGEKSVEERAEEAARELGLATVGGEK